MNFFFISEKLRNYNFKLTKKEEERTKKSNTTVEYCWIKEEINKMKCNYNFDVQGEKKNSENCLRICKKKKKKKEKKKRSNAHKYILAA